MVRTVDFGRSFLTFRVDTERKPPITASHRPPFSLNNARIQLECRCRITVKKDRTTKTFVLGASCKTERVGVEADIWTEPNADFAPIFSADRFMHLKTYARAGVDVELHPLGSGRQTDRQSGSIDDAFDNVKIDVVECEASELTSADQIVEATLANRRLVACTEIDGPRYSTMLEYPVKTMNANERDMIYQADTGPVLLPDLSRDPDDLMEGMELAYAAFNCPTWVEFIAREPTEIVPDVLVQHFSRAVRFEAINRVLCLD